MQDWYRTILLQLKTTVDQESRRRSLRGFLEACNCRSFTSGCTMRLMGIGTTTEARADMLLCPPPANKVASW